MSEFENPWKIINQKEVYDNPWIRVTEYDVLNPSGGKGIYGKVHFKNGAVAVIALDEEKNIYLVGQYRFVINAYSWEIPEGGCPENESHLETAKRELLEEAGIIAGDWKEILCTHLSNSVSDEFGIIFLATKLTQGIASPEETEDLKIRKVAFQEAANMVDRGEITDSLSVMAIQKVRLMLLQKEL